MRKLILLGVVGLLAGCQSKSTVIVNPKYRDSEIIRKFESSKEMLFITWFPSIELFNETKPGYWSVDLTFGDTKISGDGKTIGLAYEAAVKSGKALCEKLK